MARVFKGLFVVATLATGLLLAGCAHKDLMAPCSLQAASWGLLPLSSDCGDLRSVN